MFKFCLVLVLLLCCLPAGTGDDEVGSYLAELQAEAEELQLSGKGTAAEVALTPLAAAAEQLEAAGERLQRMQRSVERQPSTAHACTMWYFRNLLAPGCRP